VHIALAPLAILRARSPIRGRDDDNGRSIGNPGLVERCCGQTWSSVSRRPWGKLVPPRIIPVNAGRQRRRLIEVPAAIIEGALEMELQDAEVVTDTVDERPCIFLAGLHRAEQAIAGRLRRLGSGSLPWPAIDAEKAIPWVEGKAGVTLAESQREAVRWHCDRRSSSSPAVPVWARRRWSTRSWKS
jgi:hypothetical protein